MGYLCSCDEAIMVEGQCECCKGFDSWETLDDDFESKITFRDMSYDVDYI